MGRGEGPVQRRHRRQLCERVQYVRERVSGKESARTTRPGRAAAPGSPGRVVLFRWLPPTQETAVVKPQEVDLQNIRPSCGCCCCLKSGIMAPEYRGAGLWRPQSPSDASSL